MTFSKHHIYLSMQSVKRLKGDEVTEFSQCLTRSTMKNVTVLYTLVLCVVFLDSEIRSTFSFRILIRADQTLKRLGTRLNFIF